MIERAFEVLLDGDEAAAAHAAALALDGAVSTWLNGRQVAMLPQQPDGGGREALCEEGRLRRERIADSLRRA